MEEDAYSSRWLRSVATGAVAKQTCKQQADEKKLAVEAALNSFMTKCASDLKVHAQSMLPLRSFQARQESLTTKCVKDVTGT